MREAWEGRFVTNWDANDLITLLHTWQSGDISEIRDGGDLEKALKIIHDKGLVFGDLRDTNVMITKSDGKVGAKLVDFDWADVEEKGKYPALINTSLIGTELDPDIGPVGFMYKKHDEYALRNLIVKYCADAAYKEAKCKELGKRGD